MSQYFIKQAAVITLGIAFALSIISFLGWIDVNKRLLDVEIELGQ